MFIISNTGRHAVGALSNYTDNGMTVATFGGFDWHIYYNADAGSGNLTGGNDVVIIRCRSRPTCCCSVWRP